MLDLRKFLLKKSKTWISHLQKLTHTTVISVKRYFCDKQTKHLNWVRTIKSKFHKYPGTYGVGIGINLKKFNKYPGTYLGGWYPKLFERLKYPISAML